MNDHDGTVFLIDDDPGVRDSLTLLLSLKGVSTQPFANAESFIASYQPERPGCVLTDLRMPGMTGLELQAALHEQQIEVPVVVLTAHGDVATARAASRTAPSIFSRSRSTTPCCSMCCATLCEWIASGAQRRRSRPPPTTASSD